MFKDERQKDYHCKLCLPFCPPHITGSIKGGGSKPDIVPTGLVTFTKL